MSDEPSSSSKGSGDRLPTPSLSRRNLLTTSAFAATMISIPRSEAKVLADRPQLSGLVISEGTNFTVAPSPDGQSLLLDLLGLLWRVPVWGGPAQCISDAFADAAHPVWSPDGRMIAFQSYRSGNFQIWTADADGTAPQQRTWGFADCREPHFTPDGLGLLFSSDRSGRYAIHRLDLSNGAISQLSTGESQDSEPCISADGRRVAFVADGTRLMLMEDDKPAREVTRIQKSPNWTSSNGIYAPAFAPDGALAYTRQIAGVMTLMKDGKEVTSGEDVFPFRPGWLPDGTLIYSADGDIKRLDTRGGKTKIPFNAMVPVSPANRHQAQSRSGAQRNPVKGIVSPSLSPNGKQIAFAALNDLYLLTIGNPVPKRLTTGPSAKAYPAWSPDGRQIAYASDEAGDMNLWLLDLALGERRPLTSMAGSAAIMPSWSRDGKRIAFHDHQGALHVLDIASGKVNKAYGQIWMPGRPSFAPDGQRIAMAAFKPVSARYREGLSEILTVDLKTGEGIYTPVRENKSIATRGDDGPVWSPDGQFFAYVFASTLWVQPVTAAGVFKGPPRQLNSEVTDAPSWSGDSRTLLYLSNGKLRLLSVYGGKPATVPLRLNWAVPLSTSRTVVSDVRMWDGVSPTYRQGDLVIEGRTIADTVPPGTATGQADKRIDGKGLTLLPGLIDMHTHRQVHGYAYGNRMAHMLLSMGITATRSPGGAAYATIEDREAVAAGSRLGPRHFVTGEALDGSRIFYNFMRPVTEPGQLALEMSRARALGYDLIKTYVRMDHRTQAEVIKMAQADGSYVTSHYHYPALRQGAGGTEHLGATSRFGFSRTSSATGAAYEDVAKLFAASKAGRTPTLFAANALLTDYPELMSDPRVLALLPRWDLLRLNELHQTISGGSRDAMLETLKHNVDQIKAMMDLGWHVHTGTDAPIDTIGVSYHLNLRAMARFGISNHEVLLTATRHAGEALGEKLGVIGKGYLADLVLVDGDPLANIADVANVKSVICDGKVIELAELLSPFDLHPPKLAQNHVHVAATSSTEPYFWHDEAYLEACRNSCCDGHRHALA